MREESEIVSEFKDFAEELPSLPYVIKFML